MSFVIELHGEAKGCYITAVAAERFSSKKGSDACIDGNLLSRYGYDGFLSINQGKLLTLGCLDFAVGKDTHLKVELPYPWTKHKLHSNVPIKTHCNNGYFESAIHWLMVKINNLITK